MAEAVVATVGDAMGENVATKVDIATVQHDIASLRAELKTDIAELETRLYRQLWLMAAGIVGLTVSLTVALVKLTA